MTDIMTPQQRYYCMSQIHSKDTTPEKRVRQWLWKHGYRYRLNVKGVPGKPDIVMRKYRTAIFVNGCFWHGHDVELVVSSEQLVVKSSNCCKIPQTTGIFGWRRYSGIRKGIGRTMRFFPRMGGRSSWCGNAN